MTRNASVTTGEVTAEKGRALCRAVTFPQEIELRLDRVSPYRVLELGLDRVSPYHPRLAHCHDAGLA